MLIEYMQKALIETLLDHVKQLKEQGDVPYRLGLITIGARGVCYWFRGGKATDDTTRACTADIRLLDAIIENMRIELNVPGASATMNDIKARELAICLAVLHIEDGGDVGKIARELLKFLNAPHKRRIIWLEAGA